MPNFNPKDKCCATCAYWKGQRNYKRIGDIIYIKKGEKSECRYSKKKLFFKEKHAPQHICDQWNRWNAIK